MNIKKESAYVALVVFVFGSLFFSTSDAANPDTTLCEKDESTAFSFRVQKSTKIASLCKGTASSYLVYRFGRPGHIELQYPDTLSRESWKLFEFNGYSRSGGIQNDATGHYSLSFNNNHAEYTVFQEWRISDGKYQAGVLVDVNGARTMLKGKVESQVGALMLFEGDPNLKASD